MLTNDGSGSQTGWSRNRRCLGTQVGTLEPRGLAVWRLQWSWWTPVHSHMQHLSWNDQSVQSARDTYAWLFRWLGLLTAWQWLWGHMESDNSQEAGWKAFSDLLLRVKEGHFHCILLVTKKSAQIQGKVIPTLPQSIGSGDLFSTVR